MVTKVSVVLDGYFLSYIIYFRDNQEELNNLSELEANCDKLTSTVHELVN